MIDIISSVEHYFVEILKSVLKRFPKKMDGIKFSLAETLDKNKDELILLAAEKYITELMYKRPKEYLEGLCNVLSIEKSEFESLWIGYIEGKARRDIGVHNNWIVNETYTRKVSEVGIKLEVEIGESHMPNDGYLAGQYHNVKNIIENMHRLVVTKYDLDGLKV